MLRTGWIERVPLGTGEMRSFEKGSAELTLAEAAWADTRDLLTQHVRFIAQVEQRHVSAVLRDVAAGLIGLTFDK